MHYHAYLYRGPGEAIKPFDAARSPGGIGFETSTVPPEQICAWLAKPARMVKGTWEDPADAVAWLEERYADIADVRMHLDQQHQAPPLGTIAANALGALSRGNDVVWAWWLRGGNFIDLTVVCCPNRDGDGRCPEGRDDRRPERVRR